MEPIASSVLPADDPTDLWAGPDPVAISDLLLLAALRTHTTAIELEPNGDRTSHRVTLRRRKEVLRSLSFDHGVGEWIIDRFALLAGLDLSFPAPATGRCLIEDDDHQAELFVAVTPGPTGIAAQVWLFDQDGADRASSSIPALLPSGFVVGSYRIREVIGEGGMGIVYRADHLVLDRTVAIKVLHNWIYSADPAAADALLREARAAAALDHPGIVEVYDVATLADGRPYLVMEILKGNSLESLIASTGAADLRRAVAIGIEISRALEVAHDKGVIHRDLKPSNIFVSDDIEPRVTLVDFGAATVNDHPVAAASDPNIVVGTPYYIAPEHIQGLDCDHRIDLYSLGVLLYETLTGTLPFNGTRVREILLAHLNQPIPDLACARPDAPPALVHLVTRLLAKDPAARPADAGAVATALSAIAHELSRGRRRFWSRR